MLGSLLERAIALACYAHDGQKDKGGQPYILHPIRAMLQMKDDTSRIVAVLHDAVEDSKGRVTLATLRDSYFSDLIVDAVDVLTRRKDEAYESYITRIVLNPVALEVKIADVRDNMDPTRQLPESFQWLRTRYSKTLAFLEEARQIHGV